jgi:hypothetical protein
VPPTADWLNGRSMAGAKASAESRRAGRRPPDFTSIDGRLYSDAEAEFLRAVDDFCLRTDTRFPSNSQLFAVLLSLGYTKATPDPCPSSPPA